MEQARQGALVGQGTRARAHAHATDAVSFLFGGVCCVQEDEAKFARDLNSVKGFVIVPMDGDGNCLFRAVAHQVWADPERHDLVREQTMNWMLANREHFREFVPTDFDAYVARKRVLGVYGDHAEIQAMAEIYSRPIEVYSYGTEPMNIFQCRERDAAHAPIRLSYHGAAHYNSVLDPAEPAFGVGLGLPGLEAGVGADSDLVTQMRGVSEREATEAAMYDELAVQEALRASAVDEAPAADPEAEAAALEAALLQAALAESGEADMRAALAASLDESAAAAEEQMVRATLAQSMNEYLDGYRDMQLQRR